MKFIFAILKLRPLGGKERDFVGLVDLFAARGHAVTVLTSEPGPLALRQGIDVRVLGGRSWTNHGRLQAFAEAVCRYRQTVHDIDALIGFGWLPCADYIFVTGRPFAERNLGWMRVLPRYRSLLAQEAASVAGTNSPHLFFLCEPQAESYSRIYGVAPDRFAIMPVTFGADRALPDVHYGTRAKVRKQLGIPSDAPVFIHVAVNGYLKGLDRVIDLLPRTPEAFLISIGDTSNAMRKLAQRVGVTPRIRFLGASEQVPQFLGASDLMVHPARVENTGTVIVESLLYGVPVIASAECGYADHVVQSGAGAVIASPFSQDNFVSLVMDALDRERLVQWKAAARRYGSSLVATGGLPRVADAMLNVIADRVRARMHETQGV